MVGVNVYRMCLFAYKCVSLPLAPCSIRSVHTILYTVNIYYSKIHLTFWMSWVCLCVYTRSVHVYKCASTLLLLLSLHTLYLYSIYVFSIKWIDFSCLSSRFSCSLFLFLSIFVYLLCIIIIIIINIVIAVLMMLVEWCRAEACDWIIWFSGRIWTTTVLQCH